MYVRRYKLFTNIFQYYYKLNFNTDNSLIITENNGTEEYDSLTTYTMDGSAISADYSSSLSGNPFSLSGILNTGTEAKLTGTWFNEFGSVPGFEGGPFEVVLQ